MGVVGSNVAELRAVVDRVKPERRINKPKFEAKRRDERFPVYLDLVALAEIDPSAPKFLIEGWLPIGYATLLAADGGTGKSALALYLAVCVALNIPVWGLDVTQTTVLFLSFEDRADVLHLRLSHICRYLGVDIASLAGKLHIVDGVDTDATMFAFDPKEGPKVSAVYDWAMEQVAAKDAGLVIVDGVSDVNAGNENDRSAVKQFVRAMTRLTGPEGAVLLIAHVNKETARGGESRQGYSGSTGWNNSVRSRWYLRPMTAENDDGRPVVVPGELLLELQKANLAPTGKAIEFKWSEQSRMFLAQEPASEIRSTVLSRDGLLHDWVVIACSDSDRKGNPVPAAASGARTAWSALSAKPDCPPELKGPTGRRRLLRIVEELREDGRLLVAGRKRKNRHVTEYLVSALDPEQSATELEV